MLKIQAQRLPEREKDIFVRQPHSVLVSILEGLIWLALKNSAKYV